MKKIILIALVLVFALSAAAFASNTDVSAISNPTFHSSSNVTVRATANDTAFAAASKHLNGTRNYGASSDSTNIVFKEVGVGTLDSSTPGGDSTSAAFASGWSSL